MGWFSENGYHGNTGVSGYGHGGRPTPPVQQGGIAGAGANARPANWDPEQWDALTPEQRQQAVTAAAPPTSAQPTNGNPGAMPNFDPSQQVGHNGSINGMTREQYRDAWMGSGVTNNQGLDSWLAQHGGKRLNDSGVVTTPFGEQIDMGIGFKGGTGKAGWGGMGGGGGAPSGGPGAGAGAGGGMSLGAMGVGAGGASAGAGGATGYSTVGQSGHLNGKFDPYQYEKFEAPDPAQIANDPAYKFRMDQAMGRIQSSAAARGQLGDFKTLKALNEEAQGQASQEYQNVYGRALQTNQTNNQGRLAGFTANTNADLGYGNLDVANRNVDVANRNVDLGYFNGRNSYDLGLRNNALGYYTADQNYSLGQGNLGLGWANYGLNVDAQHFGQGFSLAQLGLQAANQAGGYGSGYAANGGNAITGAGNAQAAGHAGAGAAYGGMMNNIGGYGMGYGMYAAQGGRGRPPGVAPTNYSGPGSSYYNGANG